MRDIFGTDAKVRKECPMYHGLLDYFPKALAAVARVSFAGNEQHHPGKPLHWDKAKSTDHKDCLVRHLVEDELDKVAWRALAALEIELEEAVKEKAPVATVHGCLTCKHDDDDDSYGLGDPCYDCDDENDNWEAKPEPAPELPRSERFCFNCHDTKTDLTRQPCNVCIERDQWRPQQ